MKYYVLFLISRLSPDNRYFAKVTLRSKINEYTIINTFCLPVKRLAIASGSEFPPIILLNLISSGFVVLLLRFRPSTLALILLPLGKSSVGGGTDGEEETEDDLLRG